ncbi:FMRFamide receptor-like [Saccostrea echinata]|uniref:FMRFamide receptor-like n=1 Tax=Saccostrea echinata TaxID=191078 RepID=UPI002A7F31AD|nr:FMRFamide receptor-like [Saccostrea echinata]XP_061192428.1 FMRFamide receptor-like [Saccostrea echinata]
MAGNSTIAGFTDSGVRTVTDAPNVADDVMAVAKKMHWVTSTIFGCIFVIIGLIGNIFSILIWSRKSMRSSTGIYLIAQALADMGLLIFFFITDSLPMMAPSVKASYAFGVFFSYIGYPIFFLFVVWSIWMTVGVTVDRYIQVCWFTKAKEMCSDKRAGIGIGIIALLCFLINTPHFKTFYPIPESDRNPEDDAFSHTEFGASEGSQRYEFWVHCMFLVLVPWLTIFILNMLIICRVVRANRGMSTRKSIKGQEKAKRAENQMTRLLLTVTFVFLILIALQCITQCFFMMQPETADLRIVNEAFSVAKLGIVINSSINFFLYCLSARKFRKELFRVIGIRKGEREESFSSSTASTTLSTAKFKMSYKA